MRAHPEDRDNRRRCERWAQTSEAKELLRRLIAPEALEHLILTYGDADAKERLSVLRERFWSSWPTHEATKPKALQGDGKLFKAARKMPSSVLVSPTPVTPKGGAK